MTARRRGRSHDRESSSRARGSSGGRGVSIRPGRPWTYFVPPMPYRGSLRAITYNYRSFTSPSVSVGHGGGRTLAYRIQSGDWSAVCRRHNKYIFQFCRRRLDSEHSRAARPRERERSGAFSLRRRPPPLHHGHAHKPHWASHALTGPGKGLTRHGCSRARGCSRRRRKCPTHGCCGCDSPHRCRRRSPSSRCRTLCHGCG